MNIESVQDGVVVSMEYTLHVDGELLVWKYCCRIGK